MSLRAQKADAALAKAAHALAKATAMTEGRVKFTGRPCEKCGEAERYTATGRCIECAHQNTETNRMIKRLERLLKDALAAEARAWARVTELEDRYEPRHDPEVISSPQEAAA